MLAKWAFNQTAEMIAPSSLGKDVYLRHGSRQVKADGNIVANVTRGREVGCKILQFAECSVVDEECISERRRSMYVIVVLHASVARGAWT